MRVFLLYTNVSASHNFIQHLLSSWCNEGYVNCNIGKTADNRLNIAILVVNTKL